MRHAAFFKHSLKRFDKCTGFNTTISSYLIFSLGFPAVSLVTEFAKLLSALSRLSSLTRVIQVNRYAILLRCNQKRNGSIDRNVKERTKGY